jgi:ComEC/Rec2-related protein
VVVAGLASLLCWVMLGVAAVCIEEQPRRADHILSLLDAGKINIKSPLRYYGRLADEPKILPWGVGYDVEPSGVDYQGLFVPASGGLRLGYIAQMDRAAPLTLHTGEVIAVLTRAKLPQVFRDDGAFDRRAYLSQQGVDLVGALRAPELLELIRPARPSMFAWVSRGRWRLREEVDELWSKDTRVAGVLRAMLLGDRSFVDGDEARDFQKTGAFHVLVVAGLHVGAIAVLLFWVGRKLRWARVWTMSFTLPLLIAYVAVVEQQTPVLRAALMAAIVVVGGFFFRRLELLNSAAIAALLLLVAKPSALADSSFQLSFLAIGCIGGLALPWLDGTVRPYARALRGWRDVTKDVAYEPRPTQFRIDLRLLARDRNAFALACANRDGSRTFINWRDGVVFSRMGIVCAYAGFADRDVTATGERISPCDVRGHLCKFCSGAVDGHYCALRILCADYRTFMAGAREGSGMGGVIGDGRASSCSAEVLAFTAIELSRAGATAVGDHYFPTNVGGHRNVFAPPIRGTQGDAMEFAGCTGCDGAGHCCVSIFSANRRRETGSYSAGCRARRFLVRGFAGGQDFVD